ncbi:MAG: DUF3617 domain-containing protein [Candidatus Dormibacteria bacterium]
MIKNLKEDDMRRMIVFGVFCISATVLLAQTNKKQMEKAPPPLKNAVRFVPFNMKTGLWQDTMTTTSTGSMGIPPDLAARMTPEQKAQYEAAMGQLTNGVPRTITYKKCVKAEDLNKDPFSDPEEKCTWTTLTSTGSSGVAQGTCIVQFGGETGKMDLNIKYQLPNSETVQGSGPIALTINGHTVNSKGNFSGAWQGATCPAGVN